MVSRLRTAALCSIAMASLTGVYVYQGIIPPFVEASRVTATAGVVGALFGWCLASAVRRPPARIAQPRSLARR